MAQQTETEPGIQPSAGLSHVRGAADVALSELTIPALLAATVARFGERAGSAVSRAGRALDLARVRRPGG